MANRNTPFGAVPAYHLGGGVIRANEFPIASAYATSIFSGDFVKLVADGTIERAAAGDELLGVFQGVSWKDSSGQMNFSKMWTAATTGTEIKAMVYDDPNIVFLMQHDSVGTTPAVADVGLMYDLVATAGSTVYGTSKEQIDTSTGGTSTAQLREVALYTAPENEPAAAYAKAYVVMNEQLYRGTDGI